DYFCLAWDYTLSSWVF
nr:immunoglobulin light chain junction region [Macaca mulatta]MOY06447.1 immunoglobulin light chain junction region [Macaca mulatta]MOY06759.1 immunoglobulin light chain junction region [Macaca mulatta]MOY07449.1 immunoglobulin light chain junction region [Macaca mulatta]